MAAINWGTRGDGLAVVFCEHCRAVLSEPIPINEAKQAHDKAKVKHHCAYVRPYNQFKKG